MRIKNEEVWLTYGYGRCRLLGTGGKEKGRVWYSNEKFPAWYANGTPFPAWVNPCNMEPFLLAVGRTWVAAKKKVEDWWNDNPMGLADPGQRTDGTVWKRNKQGCCFLLWDPTYVDDPLLVGGVTCPECSTNEEVYNIWVRHYDKDLLIFSSRDEQSAKKYLEEWYPSVSPRQEPRNASVDITRRIMDILTHEVIVDAPATGISPERILLRR